MTEKEALNEAQKAIEHVKQLRALEKYVLNLALDEYKNPAHNKHILIEISSVMRYMFEQQHKNYAAAAAHVLDLSFINQVENNNMPPDKLKFFVDNMIPKYRKQFEMRMVMAMLRPDPLSSQNDEKDNINSIKN